MSNQLIDTKTYEDGTVQFRITPIKNGYVVKGGHKPVFFENLRDAADGMNLALTAAFSGAKS